MKFYILIYKNIIKKNIKYYKKIKLIFKNYK